MLSTIVGGFLNPFEEYASQIGAFAKGKVEIIISLKSKPREGLQALQN